MKKILTLLAIIVLTSSFVFAQEISNEARLEYNKGVDLYKSGQYERAMSSFRRAIDISPDYIDSYYNLGTILEYLEQTDAALSVFRQIIVRCPDDYESVYKAAQLSEKLGNIEEAQNYLVIIPRGVSQYPAAVALSQKLKLSRGASSQMPSVIPKKQVQQGALLYENLAGPTGMVTDDFGNLYIAGFTDNTITKIMPNGKRVIFVKNQKLNGPIGLAIDVYGNLYVANYNSDNVLKITKNGVSSILIGNVKKPYCLYLNGRMLFVSSQGANSVLRYKLPD